MSCRSVCTLKTGYVPDAYVCVGNRLPVIPAQIGIGDKLRAVPYLGVGNGLFAVPVYIGFGGRLRGVVAHVRVGNRLGAVSVYRDAEGKLCTVTANSYPGDSMYFVDAVCGLTNDGFECASDDGATCDTGVVWSGTAGT